jgi:multiple sugar transport system ATP-binding protein
MVFQSYALYPHMSVRGNIAFGLKMAGTPKAEIDRKVENAASTLAIAPILVLGWISQKQLVRGLTFGAVK